MDQQGHAGRGRQDEAGGGRAGARGGSRKTLEREDRERGFQEPSPGELEGVLTGHEDEERVREEAEEKEHKMKRERSPRKFLSL